MPVRRRSEMLHQTLVLPKLAKAEKGTSTNQATTPEMREGYRNVLIEKQVLLEEIQRAQEEIKACAHQYEGLKSDSQRLDAQVQERRTSRASHESSDAGATTPLLAETPPPSELVSVIPIITAKPPKAPRPPKQGVLGAAARPPKQKKAPVVIQKKRVREVFEGEEDALETAATDMGVSAAPAADGCQLLEMRKLHMEIASMHFAIQQRCCFACAFIALLLFLIVFY